MSILNIKDTQNKDSKYMLEPGIESLIAGLLNLILCFSIVQSLKNNFKTFYEQHMIKLVMATMLLVISNISTGIYFSIYF